MRLAQDDLPQQARLILGIGGEIYRLATDSEAAIIPSYVNIDVNGNL